MGRRWHREWRIRPEIYRDPLSRLPAPPPTPWPDGGPESLISPYCRLAISKTPKISRTVCLWRLCQGEKLVAPDRAARAVNINVCVACAAMVISGFCILVTPCANSMLERVPERSVQIQGEFADTNVFDIDVKAVLQGLKNHEKLIYPTLTTPQAEKAQSVEEQYSNEFLGPAKSQAMKLLTDWLKREV
ncbi:hypothetical protein PoB_000203300 [Plakobranchus ocellatus]|uniref:Uncharacterized protein n=1 Tax=Plakobranchus ocellatus TaxID=259542 RepID=A0AAV3XYS8_9GAST|nr:hypothetical protein PoB_000203300 [Plakobranchus ocellatus]